MYCPWKVSTGAASSRLREPKSRLRRRTDKMTLVLSLSLSLSLFLKILVLSALSFSSARAEITTKTTHIRFGRGDDTVGNPHGAQNYRFELFELILLLKLCENTIKTTNRYDDYLALPLSKASQVNERGAMGSKNLPAYQKPCFSLLGMVLRTLVWF